MDAFLRNTVLVVCMWLMLAGVCFGKQVYLMNGDMIDCESFWRRGNMVIVKINRDTMLEFARSEVDVRRTFPETGKKPHHVRRKKSAGTTLKHRSAAQPVKAAAKPDPVADETPVSASASAPVPPLTPAPAPTANEPVQPEMTQPTPADPSVPLDRNEIESQGLSAAEMMAEAVKNNDPELMKKAIEAQKNSLQPNALRSAAMNPTYLIIFLFFTLLTVVSTWVIFSKAGHSGWKSLIPIYNLYILMLIAGKPGWWLLLLFIPLAGTVFYFLAMLSLAERFGRGILFGLGIFFLPMFFLPMLAFGGSKGGGAN